jgi:hypothetical protein
MESVSIFISWQVINLLLGLCAFLQSLNWEGGNLGKNSVQPKRKSSSLTATRFMGPGSWNPAPAFLQSCVHPDGTLFSKLHKGVWASGVLSVHLHWEKGQCPSAWAKSSILLREAIFSHWGLLMDTDLIPQDSNCSGLRHIWKSWDWVLYWLWWSWVGKVYLWTDNGKRRERAETTGWVVATNLRSWMPSVNYCQLQNLHKLS